MSKSNGLNVLTAFDELARMQAESLLKKTQYLFAFAEATEGSSSQTQKNLRFQESLQRQPDQLLENVNLIMNVFPVLRL